MFNEKTRPFFGHSCMCRIYKFPRVVISYNDFYIDIWKHISLKIYKSMLCSIVYNLFPGCLIFLICLQLDSV